MSTTLTMWLGIAFLVLGVLATVLQAWLWGFPMLPDPGGPDPNGRSTAPRGWTRLHRLMGLAYVVIYVALMIEMIPRLWEYQVELPARTIIHACMGIIIGVVLVTKIAIIRWFKHFGQSLPALGLTLVTATIILAVLSIPYALQAHSLGDELSAENLARVERHLSKLPETRDQASALATREGLSRGRHVLVTKCVVCHDLRTILRKPRTPAGWHSVNVRMAKKPAVGVRLSLDELPAVTAYLVAITPELQESIADKRREERQREAQIQGSERGPREPPASKSKPPPVVNAAPADTYDPVLAKARYDDVCSQCHELSDVDEAAPLDEAGWREVLQRMNDDEDAGIEAEDFEMIVRYLAETKGK